MTSNSTHDATVTGLHIAADFPPGSMIGGRYRIIGMLGIGGMGVVYRAEDQALDVPVALKLLRPELAHRPELFERFRQELLLARQVSNPHVVRIHDLAQHADRWVLSMDFVDGQSLDRYLDRKGPLAVDDAVAIARQIADGLAAAHAKGVIHRDLKPANILLDAAGNAYISDFGVARSLAATGTTSGGLTHGGAVIGTPDYLSPEQARGDPVDARSDLYSLGLILYEMLAGKLPFTGGTLAEALAQRMLRTPDPVDRARPDLPRWLVRLVDRLLRLQPAHRLQSAGEIIAAIDRRELSRDWRAGRSAWLVLCVGLLIALGGLAWWWQTRTPATNSLATTPTALIVPLDRLLVLPLSGSGDGARDAALGAHLRDALAGVPGFAVVDGERTLQALRQFDPSGNAVADPAALRRAAAAQRVLQLRLEQRQDGWIVAAELSAADGARQTWISATADDPIAALRVWNTDPVTSQRLGLGNAAATLDLPASGQALDAYGAGLLAWRAGDLESVRSALATAIDLDSSYATAWLANAQVARAIGADDQALDAVIQGQNAANQAPAALQREFAAYRALLEGDAATAIAQWRVQLQDTPDDTRAELNLARALGTGGDLASAIKRLQTLSTRDPQDPRVWFELGKLSILQGDARLAVDDYLTRALVAFKRSRDVYGEAETVNALGVGYGRLGQTEDAAEQYRKAIELRRRLGNQRGVATSLRNLANTLSLTGDFTEADAALREARALSIALGDRAGQAAIDNELGLLAEERGDYPTALEAFQRAQRTWQQVGDTHGAAEALNNIGYAHYQLGDYGDAQVYWQQARDAYTGLGEQTGRVRTLQNLGLLATARGQWREARQWLQQSLSLAERQQMLEEIAVSRRNLAELDLQQGHLQAAIEQAGKAGAAFAQRADARGGIDTGLLHARALLAAHADAQAGRVLDGLQPTLATASIEQQAIARLLRAQLQQNSDIARAGAAGLSQAQALAQRSGVRQLQLRIALAQAARDPTRLPALDAPTAALGHASLRMQWLQLHMAKALAAGDAPAAVRDYSEATGLLRAGDALPAYALHVLGARARRMVGDRAGADAADTRAHDALNTLNAQLPPALRDGFARALAAQRTLP